MPNRSVCTLALTLAGKGLANVGAISFEPKSKKLYSTRIDQFGRNFHSNPPPPVQPAPTPWVQAPPNFAYAKMAGCIRYPMRPVAVVRNGLAKYVTAPAFVLPAIADSSNI